MDNRQLLAKSCRNTTHSKVLGSTQMGELSNCAMRLQPVPNVRIIDYLLIVVSVSLFLACVLCY